MQSLHLDCIQEGNIAGAYSKSRQSFKKKEQSDIHVASEEGMYEDYLHQKVAASAKV